MQTLYVFLFSYFLSFSILYSANGSFSQEGETRCHETLTRLTTTDDDLNQLGTAALIVDGTRDGQKRRIAEAYNLILEFGMHSEIPMIELMRMEITPSIMEGSGTDISTMTSRLNPSTMQRLLKQAQKRLKEHAFDVLMEKVEETDKDPTILTVTEDVMPILQITPQQVELTAHEAYSAYKNSQEHCLRLVDRLHQHGFDAVFAWLLSCENFRLRPPEQRSIICKIIKDTCLTRIEYYQQKRVCIKFIGDRDELPIVLRTAMERIEDATKQFLSTGKILLLAVNYSGQKDVDQASVRMILDFYKNVVKDKREISDVSKELIRSGRLFDYLSTAFLAPRGLQMVDLLIRTSSVRSEDLRGRQSGFMPLETMDSEPAPVDVTFPEFTIAHLDRIVETFRTIERTRGGDIAIKQTAGELQRRSSVMTTHSSPMI